MTSSSTIDERPSRFSLMVFAGPGMLIALGMGLLLSYEALHVGLLASPEEISEYRFGSEAMVGVGGWHYASQGRYVVTAVAEGILSILLGGAFLWAAIHRRRPFLGWCYGALLIGMAYLTRLLWWGI